MFFFTNFFGGISAANQIRRLVLGDKRLLVYPIIMVVIAALLAVAVGAVSFIVVSALTGATVSLASGINQTPWIITLIVTAFLVYVALYFAASYFTTAMLIAFKSYLRGNKMSFGESLGQANTYITLLFEWALLFALITVIIDLVEYAIKSALSRYGIRGNLISGIITGVGSIALSAISMFSLPVIIDNRTGPLATLRKSATFIVKNFGETFGGLLYSELIQYIFGTVGGIIIFVGLITMPQVGAVGLVFLMPVLLFIVVLSWSEVGAFIILAATLIAAFSAPNYVTPLVVLMVGAGFAIVTLGHLLKYVLFACFKLIVYEYKTSGIVPKGIDAETLDSAVKTNQNAPRNTQGGGIGGGPGEF